LYQDYQYFLSCEMTVASQVAFDAVDLQDLIDKIESIGNLDTITKSCKIISATSDVVSAGVEVVKNTDKLLEDLAAFDTKHTSYITAHDEFLKAIQDLQDTMMTEMENDPTLYYPGVITPTPTPAPGTTSIFENDNVKNKVTELDKKILAYQTAIDSLASNVGDIKSAIGDILGSLSTMKEKNDTLKDLSKEKGDKLAKTVTDSSSIFDTIITQFAGAFSTFNKDTYINDMDKNVLDLQAQSLKLQNFDVQSITADTSIKYANEFPEISNINVPNKDLLETAKQKAGDLLGGSDNGQSIMTIINNMVDTLKGMFSLTGLYDGNLSATLDTNYLKSLNTSTGSDTGSAQHILESIKAMLDASTSFTKALGNWNLLGALIAVVDAINAVLDFFKAIISWFTGVCARIVELVDGGANGFYESLLLCGYCVYDFPNRTSYDASSTGGLTKSALTGYSYSDIATATKINDYTDPTSNKDNPYPQLSALIGLLKTLGDDKSAKDRTFCGAELEYILIGSQSEIVNQSGTFMFIYLLRLVLDILQIATNEEVAAMASSATVGAPVVYALEIIAEPLCDTIILVNGGDSYLIKSFVYLTPTGALQLVDDLFKAAKIGDDLKEKILKSANPDSKPTSPVGGKTDDAKKMSFFKMDYKDHVLFMLMFTVPEDDALLPRIQHLIQMESASHYTAESSGFDFDLKKSYVYLKFNMVATLNPLFSVGTLSKTGYSYKNTVYRGY